MFRGIVELLDALGPTVLVLDDLHWANPPGQDPTPGIVSVASFFDEDAGVRDGTVSDFSSRGDRTRLRTWPDISAPREDHVVLPPQD